MTARNLTSREISLAKQVFANSLFYDRIYIEDSYLPGNQGTPVTVAWYNCDHHIFFGKNAFKAGCDSPQYRATFIHELTHAWQGEHGMFCDIYMYQSLLAQGKKIVTDGNRNRAYDYDIKKLGSWDDYNVEQQASIVGDWYDPAKGNMSTSDPRYRFIANHIRPGKN